MDQTTDGPALTQLLEETFFPEASRRRGTILDGGLRFAHYTTAEVAMSIIQNGAVWMRNATTMNDFSEISHGLVCISEAWRSEGGERFKAALEDLHVGLVGQIEQQFDGWQHDMRNNTFLTCLSEHPATEDRLGRLSMWRAYGGRSGVALVLNMTPFTATTDELKAYSSPVFYGEGTEIEAQLDAIADKLVEHRVLLGRVASDGLREIVFTALRYAALCTKHPAFAEEREWRVIYSPSLGRSPVIEPFVHAVRGVPQVVQKIPLANDPANGLHGAAVPDLLHRLIIGPTADPRAMFDAFVVLLAEAGVPNPEERIIVSGIPLRQW
jgi:DUF2971 family protein